MFNLVKRRKTSGLKFQLCKVYFFFFKLVFPLYENNRSHAIFTIHFKRILICSFFSHLNSKTSQYNKNLQYFSLKSFNIITLFLHSF